MEATRADAVGKVIAASHRMEDRMTPARRNPSGPKIRHAVLALFLLLVTHASAGAQPVVEAARAVLPTAVSSAGVLKVATSLQWPPFAYATDAGPPDGIDIRLVKLLAGKLGLRAEIEDVKFPAIVPGVAGGRYDMGLNQINITAERAKVADFVPYFNSGYGLLVRKGSAALDVNNLCGKTLVLTQGSAQVGAAERLSAACVKAGQQKIAFLLYPNSAETYLALANGRGDGFLTGKASGVYIAKGSDKLEMLSGMLEGSATLSGIVIAKGNKALHEALRLALESAIQDGSYMAILKEFGVADGAVTVEQVRSAPPA